MRISDWSSDVCSSDLADGCHCPWPDGSPEATHARRAVTRTRPAHRGSDLQRAHRAQPVRGHHPAGRAEPARVTCPCPLRLCPATGTGRHCRNSGCSAERPDCPDGVSRTVGEKKINLLADALAQGIMIGAVYARSEEHTSEPKSLMSTAYAVFCLKKTKYCLKHHNSSSTSEVR